MGRVCIVVAGMILPVMVAVIPAPRAEAAEPAAPAPIQIGLPESLFNGLPASVVGAASKPFQSMFEKQTGLKGEISVAKDYVDITDKLRSGKLDVAVFHGFEYAWVKHHDDLVPLLVTIPGSKLHACLVVNANSKVKTANELKGDCIAIPGATKAYCRLYLDRLKEKVPAGCCGTAKLNGNSVEEALDAVASNQCEAALVDAAALVGYQKNKPGVGMNLRVLIESNAFPSAVIVYRKDVFTAQTAAKVRTGLIKGVQTPQGQLLTGLWKLKGFSEMTPEYQKELDECLKVYPAPKK